jgi:hypothetical protein
MKNIIAAVVPIWLIFLASLASAGGSPPVFYNYDYQYSYQPSNPQPAVYYIPDRNFDDGQHVYTSRIAQHYSRHSYQKNYDSARDIPVLYYGSDRGFVDGVRPLNSGTPTNIALDDGARIFYKYTPYFGGYYETYKCYDRPPKDKLFYVKCP